MRRWFLLPLTKRCQLSHTHSELHIINKPRMTDFTTEANMFLQQSSLTGLAPRKRSWISSSDMQYSFWKYSDEKLHQPSFMCWFTQNQQELLVKGPRTSLLCSPYMSCTVTAQETGAQYNHLAQLWFCFTKYMYKNMKQTAEHWTVTETKAGCEDEHRVTGSQKLQA